MAVVAHMQQDTKVQECKVSLKNLVVNEPYIVQIEEVLRNENSPPYPLPPWSHAGSLSFLMAYDHTGKFIGIIAHTHPHIHLATS